MTLPPTLSEQDLQRPLSGMDDYAAMLQKAGYATRAGKTGDGKPAFSVVWKKGDWNFLVNISPSEVNGQKYLALVSPLATIPDMAQIPVASIVALLEMQDATLGWYFVLSRKAQRFYMARTLPASGITTAMLLGELKNFEAGAVKTQSFWDPKLWTKAPAAPPK